jgi:hypothetical protein
MNIGSDEFVEVDEDFPDLDFGFAKFGDIDNDGDEDVILAGRLANFGLTTKLFLNENYNFTSLSVSIEPIADPYIDLFDYDNDSDLDVLITGKDLSGNSVTKIFKNNFPEFIEVNIPFHPMGFARLADINSDGYTDNSSLNFKRP